MATTYGAPTDLDLSACSVTPTGGTTSQTLADLGKTVGDNATAIAKAQSTASSALGQSAQAVTAANTAATNAKTALTTSTSASDVATAAQQTADAAIPKSSVQTAGGPVIYDTDGKTVLVNPNTGSSAQVAFGSTANPVTAIIKAYASGKGTSPDATLISYGTNGTGNNDGVWGAGCATFHPTSDNVSNLGLAGWRWASVFAGSGVIQTSDANEKTVVGILGNEAYADSNKLIAAGRAIRKSITVFTFSGGKRQHVGAIAQEVYSALQGAGLDPASFGVWGRDALMQHEEIQDDEGRLVSVETKPVLDGNGRQVYRQSLRYDELAMLLIAAGEAEAQENASALAALTTRVAALEAKAGA